MTWQGLVLGSSGWAFTAALFLIARDPQTEVPRSMALMYAGMLLGFTAAQTSLGFYGSASSALASMFMWLWMAWKRSTK